MVASLEAVALLRSSLDLNEYEARVYLALLKLNESSEIRSISETSQVPLQRIYDVLDKLRERNPAVVRMVQEKPKKYVAASPEVLADSVLTRKKLELESKKQSEIRSMEEKTRREIEDLEHRISDLRRKINIEAEGVESSIASIATQIEGWENIQNAIITLLKGAEKEFFCVTRPPDWYDLSILGIARPRTLSDWHAAIDERRIDIRWIIPKEAVPSYVGWKTLLQLPRRLISANKIKEKFLIVDGRRVLMNLLDPLTRTYSSVAILIENVGVAGIFRDQFLQSWNAGKPAEEFSKKFQKMEANIFRRMKKRGLSELETRIYLSLLRIGACSPLQILRDLQWNDPRDTPKIEEIGQKLSELKRKGIVSEHEVLKWFIPADPTKSQTFLPPR